MDLESNLCEVCKINQFKYKCPKCNIKTCCLICVKDHKKKNSCNGQKDKFSTETKLNKIGYKEMVQDMQFLNEAINATNRSSSKVFNMIDDEEKKEKEKKNKYKKKLVKKMRNINLFCSPMIMSKFSENKSYVNFKTKSVFWTIKFLIHSENKKFEHIFQEIFDDSQYSLNDILEYLNKNKQQCDLNFLLLLNNLSQADLTKWQILYRLNLREMDSQYIKGKLIKLNKIHYEECDKTMLLKDLLEGKDVYEYPEFHIIL